MILGIIKALLGVASPIVYYLLKKAGAKEEMLRAYQDAIKSVQSNRINAVRPSLEEEEMLQKIRDKLDGKSKP